VIVFTSISENYIPKAKILAKSFKQNNPGWTFVLCLVERSIDPAVKDPIFDHIITAGELEIPEFESFMFKHAVVEACTAVKGYAFKKLLSQFPREQIFLYLDPDIFVLGPFTELLNVLKEHDIILTPHLCVPEDNLDAIMDNEICALKHGVFNLGFLAIKRSSAAIRFIDWWKDRLHEFCRADIPNGLFTDQRWMDLAPCFFNVHILKHPGYNVATWNLKHRPITRDDEGNLYAARLPLRFYHFTGFDSGANEIMLLKYCPDRNNPVYALRKQYLELLEKNGQNELGNTPWSFDFYSNGNRINKEHRETYRSNRELQRWITNPFETEKMNKFNSRLMNKKALTCKAANILRKTIDTYRAGGFHLVFRKVTNKLK
jgi:hypothetical protein